MTHIHAAFGGTDPERLLQADHYGAAVQCVGTFNSNDGSEACMGRRSRSLQCGLRQVMLGGKKVLTQLTGHISISGRTPTLEDNSRLTERLTLFSSNR